MKWTNSTTDPAGKIQVSRVNKALRELDREHHTKIRKSGIFGVTEGYNRQSSYEVTEYMIGGENKLRADVTAVQEKLHARFNSTVSRSNVNELIAAIEAEMPALIAARLVEDERKTQAQHDAECATSQAESARRDQEQTARTAAENARFIAHYGQGDQPVQIPDGMMPVTISLKYDNSDSMSDYFDRHASLGPDFLLGYVPRQAQTEALARRLLNRYPEFAAIGLTTNPDGSTKDGFTWHTEKYSMGHGNYLDGTGFELPADLQGLRKVYRGGDVTRARWQVEFSYSGRYGAKEILPLKGYPGANGNQAVPAGAGAATGAIATVTLNVELNGVEIRFPARPDDATLEPLRRPGSGWRWSRRSRCWYARQTPDRIAFAYKIADVQTPATQSSASQPPGPDRFDMQVEDNMAAACGLA